MPKPRHHSWFKFEWNPWRNDPQLRRCSKETRGFWIDAVAVMEELDTYFIEGTVEELCRDVVCTEGEFTRSIAELARTGAATVVKNQGSVKIISRRVLKAHNLTEYNRLKKQEERDKKAVKKVSSDSSKNQSIREEREEDKKKNSTNVELVREIGAAAKISEPELPTKKLAKRDARDIRIDHPAIIAIREVTERYPPKEIWNEIIGKLGFDVNLEFLRKCYVQWRVAGFKPVNYGWALDWYINNEIPPPPVPTGRDNANEQRLSEREKSAVRGYNGHAEADRLIAEGLRKREEAAGRGLLGDGSQVGPEIDQPLE